MRVYEVGLFDVTGPDVLLVGTTLDPEVVGPVRDVLLAQRQAELARLAADDSGGRLTLVAPDEEPPELD